MVIEEYISEMEMAMRHAKRIQAGYDIGHNEITRMYIDRARGQYYMDNPHAQMFIDEVIKRVEESIHGNKDMRHMRKG